MTSRRNRRALAAIGGLSAALMALQLALMRLFAIESYASFGAMVISMAMLGFAVSGTLLAVLRNRWVARPGPWLDAASVAFLVALPACWLIGHAIPFVPPQVLQSPEQGTYVVFYYLAAFLPFFSGSLVVGLLLVSETAAVARLYAADLVGAAGGALLTLGALFVLPPAWLPFYTLVLAALGVAPLVVRRGRVVIVAGLAAGAGLVLLATQYELNISEYKGIQYALASAEVTGARVVAGTQGPLGMVQIVESSAERSAPGLSDMAPEDAVPPVDAGLYVDGERAGSVSLDRPREALRFFDYSLTALPYGLVPAPRVLIIGLGGGTPVREALYHGARAVVAADIDARRVALLRSAYRQAMGGLLDRPEVDVRIADGRAVAATSEGAFDLVMVPYLEGSALSFAGSSTQGENYLYTVEALAADLRALTPRGVFAVALRLSEPPRPGPRLIVSLAAAVRTAWPEVGQPGAHFLFLRSTFHGLALVSRTPWSAAQQAHIRQFAAERGFDLSYLSGLSDAETNVYTQIPREVFREAAVVAFEAPERLAAWLAAYPFDLTPTTDDRPFFQAFLKLATVPWLKENAPEPERWYAAVPFDLWWQPLQWITLAQAFCLGLLVVLIPLVARRRGVRAAPGKAKTVLYFSALGLGFMVAEMVLIQKLTLFLASPMVAAALVLAALLVASGVGSFVSGRFAARPRRAVRLAALIVAGLLGLYAGALDPVLAALLPAPTLVRAGIAFAFVGLPAFFLGMFFPLGLTALHGDEARRALVPWAWAVNGAVAVMAVVAASALATVVGFRWLLLGVAALYLGAGLVFPVANGQAAAQAAAPPAEAATPR